MKNLLEIPTEEFPLNWERYNRLMDEIQNAARGFVDLDGHGWPRGREIDSRLMRAHHALWETWNLIQETEGELRAREAAKPKA